MSRRSSRRGASAPVFPTLSEGTRKGLHRLVSDHRKTVARMLDIKDSEGEDGESVDRLCEKCAQVMKQQQLSPASFLARFFAVEVLSQHAQVLQKSSKGSAATLSDRIAGTWSKNLPIPAGKEDKVACEEEESNAKAKKGSTTSGKEGVEGSKELVAERKRKNAPNVEEANYAEKDDAFPEKKSRTKNKLPKK